jgi:hypothetical protein
MVSELGMQLWRLGRENPSLRARAWAYFGLFSSMTITLRVFVEGEKAVEEQLPLPERQSPPPEPALFFRPVLFLQR